MHARVDSVRSAQVGCLFVFVIVNENARRTAHRPRAAAYDGGQMGHLPPVRLTNFLCRVLPFHAILGRVLP